MAEPVSCAHYGNPAPDNPGRGNDSQGYTMEDFTEVFRRYIPKVRSGSLHSGIARAAAAATSSPAPIVQTNFTVNGVNDHDLPLDIYQNMRLKITKRTC